MLRREALKLLAATTALPLLSRPAFSLFQAVHQQLAETPALKTLDPGQNALVTAICDLIIPPTETPGAKAARVNEFIDLILTEWYQEEDRKLFLNGLSDVDFRSRDNFGRTFLECSSTQQTQILTQLDAQLTGLRRPEYLRRRGGFGPPEKQFFYLMKQLTLVGYYTSQIGFEQELQAHIIPLRHAGCVPLEPEGAR
jgi:hypothetical protein